MPPRRCSIISAINYIRSRTKCHKKTKEACLRSKRSRDTISKHDSPFRKRDSCELSQEEAVRTITECDFKRKCKVRSVSFSDDRTSEDVISEKRGSLSNVSSEEDVLCECDSEQDDKWLVHTYDTESGRNMTYSCKDLVLANGASDLPNR